MLRGLQPIPINKRHMSRRARLSAHLDEMSSNPAAANPLAGTVSAVFRQRLLGFLWIICVGALLVTTVARWKTWQSDSQREQTSCTAYAWEVDRNVTCRPEYCSGRAYDVSKASSLIH